MPGIYGFYHQNRDILKNHFQNFFRDGDKKLIQNESTYKNFTYGRSVLPAFREDRFFHENERLILALDGVLFEGDDPLNTFIRKYTSSGINFISSIRGFFSGFIYDKKKERLFLFTDPFATRSIYLYTDSQKRELFFSSELGVLTKLADELNISLHPDPDAFHCMLSLGYMLDNITYAKEIKRLDYATIAEVDLVGFSIEQRSYFNFNQPQKKVTIAEATEDVDDLIQVAVREEWSKDQKETDTSLAFLSGGFDSRVNVLMAIKQNYSPIHCLNFAQTGTYDHTIAREICEDLNLPFHFYPLDDGAYFENSIEHLVKANDGMVSVIGASHMYQALKSLPLSPYVLAHSGQLGDVLFGSFTRSNFNLEKNIGKLGSVNDPLILKQISFLPEIIERYENNIELFSFEQRQVKGTLNGDRMCSHLIDIASPFYNRELLRFCLSLPTRLKENQKLYKNWMWTKQPQMMKYKWERAGIVPKNRWITEAAVLYKRIKQKMDQLRGRDAASMNPFDLWIRENSQLSDQIEDLYKNQREGVDEPWLIEHSDHVFKKHGARGKFAAITALLSYNHHLNKKYT